MPLSVTFEAFVYGLPGAIRSGGARAGTAAVFAGTRSVAVTAKPPDMSAKAVAAESTARLLTTSTKLLSATSPKLRLSRTAVCPHGLPAPAPAREVTA